MAILNKEKGCVVLRIVYAGPPMSGKTESLKSLSSLLFGAHCREEELYCPDEADGRTLYFDWLNYTGGYFKGYKVNCQLISVPGQKTLKSRRKLLLEMADVVVFVLDSDAKKLDAALDYYREMQPWLEREDEPPIGVIIQANKRDVQNVAPMPLIYETFEDNPNLLALETIATNSSGIRETFVTSVRIGLERASWLLDHGKIVTGTPHLDSGDGLLTLIQQSEAVELVQLSNIPVAQQPVRQIVDLDFSSSQLGQFIRDELNEHASGREKHVSIEAKSGPTSSDAGDVQRSLAVDAAGRNGSSITATGENNALTHFFQPSLPHKNVIAGSVFPPISGRIILHKLADAEFNVELTSEGGWEARIGNQWRLLSGTDDSFDSSNDARMHLVQYANTHKKLGALLSEHRCMVIVESDRHNEWRVWQIVRNEVTLDELLNNAFMESSPKRIAEKVYIIAEKFLHAYSLFTTNSLNLPLDIRFLGLNRNMPIFTGYLHRYAVDSEVAPVKELLKQNFGPPISKALRENQTLIASVPHILHPLVVFAKGKTENEEMVEVLRTLFIGEH
ncbi:MAG: hypothetical protein ACXWE4_04300 [Methylobacter sp.]